MFILDFILGVIAVAGFVASITFCSWLIFKILSILNIFYIIIYGLLLIALIGFLGTITEIGAEFRESITNKINKHTREKK